MGGSIIRQRNIVKEIACIDYWAEKYSERDSVYVEEGSIKEWKAAQGRKREWAKDKDKINSVLPVVIRVDASLRNSIFESKSIFDFSKRSGIREDFDQFSREILGINHWKEKSTK